MWCLGPNQKKATEHCRYIRVSITVPLNLFFDLLKISIPGLNFRRLFVILPHTLEWASLNGQYSWWKRDSFRDITGKVNKSCTYKEYFFNLHLAWILSQIKNIYISMVKRHIIDILSIILNKLLCDNSTEALIFNCFTINQHYWVI